MSLPTATPLEVTAAPLPSQAVARVSAVDGTPLPFGPRAALLVALVAVGAADGRAVLASLLYPQLPSAAARRNLRQLLHKQRVALDDVIEQRGDRLSLRAGVRISFEPGQLDRDVRRSNARQALLSLAGLLAEAERLPG